MPYNRFVQVGRVAYIAIGPQQGRLCVIVDIIDQNRALVDGPTTGVKRQSMNFKFLHLTKFVVKIPHSAREGTVRRQWAKAEIDSKWAASQWAKKQAAKVLRTNMTDFDRFKLMRAKQARNRVINMEFGKLRLKARKARTSAKPAAKKAVAKK